MCLLTFKTLGRGKVHRQRNRVTGRVHILLLAALVGCNSPGKRELGTAEGARAAAAPTAPATERYRLDLDDDGVADELVLHKMSQPDGPGVYDSLETTLSRGGSHAVAGSWDPPAEPPFDVRDNRVSSTSLFVGRFPRAGTLVFLFGEDVSCCLQDLTVYRITARGLEPYLARHEFNFATRLTQGATAIAGTDGLSEMVGTSAPDAASAISYDPILVTALDATPRIDTAASAARTRAALGGFAGLAPRENVRVVTRRDSTRYVWDETRKRRLP